MVVGAQRKTVFGRSFFMGLQPNSWVSFRARRALEGERSRRVPARPRAAPSGRAPQKVAMRPAPPCGKDGFA